MTAEELFRGRLIMAPMTRGTDLPFRLLATEWGATVCLGEIHSLISNCGADRNSTILIRVVQR